LWGANIFPSYNSSAGASVTEIEPQSCLPLSRISRKPGMRCNVYFRIVLHVKISYSSEQCLLVEWPVRGFEKKSLSYLLRREGL